MIYLYHHARERPRADGLQAVGMERPRRALLPGPRYPQVGQGLLQQGPRPRAHEVLGQARSLKKSKTLSHTEKNML